MLGKGLLSRLVEARKFVLSSHFSARVASFDNAIELESTTVEARGVAAQHEVLSRGLEGAYHVVELLI